MKKDKKEHNSENECEQASENNENLTEETERRRSARVCGTGKHQKAMRRGNGEKLQICR